MLLAVSGPDLQRQLYAVGLILVMEYMQVREIAATGSISRSCQALIS
jgi:hypothetical protein